MDPSPNLTKKIITIPLNKTLDVALNPKAPNGQPFSVTQAVHLNTLQKLQPMQKDEMFTASLQKGDYLELPAFIFVETRFITKNVELDLIGPDVQLFELPNGARQRDEAIKINRKSPKPHKAFANAIVQADILRENRSTDTNGPNPTRNRQIQTEHRRLKSIGVQCCIDDIPDWVDNTDTNSLEIHEVERDPLIFSAFICNNTILYNNDKIECRICGEVVGNFSKMEMHLALHYGPKALCFRCGLLFEHKAQLRHHMCDGRENKPQFLRCPHFRCDVIAISKLELYDHINEHISDHCYKCENCGRGYPTYKELEQHTKLRKECRSSKLIFPYKRDQLHGIRNMTSRIRAKTIHNSNGKKALKVLLLNKSRTSAGRKRCPTCLKICSNQFKYRKHSHRCFLKHVHRLKITKKIEK